MDKRIEEYLDSVVPERLSKRRKMLIREELQNHISDHIEFYTEIGSTARTRASKKRWPTWATTEV